VTAETQSFLDRHYLLIRRLHSLTGIAPIGVFLFPHLITNSSIVWGRMTEAKHGDAGVEMFQHEVNFIHDLPALILIEWGVLFLPIIFHAVVGVWFATSGRPNVDRYRYQSNWRYTLQRISGYIGVLFIFMHVTSLRYGWEYGGLMPAFDAHHAASSTALHFQEGALGLGMAFVYLVCVLMLVFHFANGLWTAGITWGLTVSVAAQKRWGYVCAAIGIGLSAAAVAAIIGFSTLDVESARAIELELASHSTP
jgi:succinate dehydrogenase / fumarate reductase cytochrome b subunit